MTTSDGHPCDLDGMSLLRAFSQGEASPSEAVATCLERLESAGRRLNAVVTLMPDRALVAAQESARRWRAGQPRPLEGIPIGVKDVIATHGIPTTCGSAILDGYMPSHDATVIKRLRRAGAIPVAKLQTFAFANGDPVNVDFGPTRNPHDGDRMAGGSSSGSAAAVGAKCVPIALGTDTGGSIRIPASYCGVSGLKPTFGRVSRHGVMPLSWTLDHVGPMARSVRDLRAVLQVIAGYDKNDGTTHHVSALREGRRERLDVRELRVGIAANYFDELWDGDSAAAFLCAVEIFRDLKAMIVPVFLERVGICAPIGRCIISAEASSLHEPLEGRRAEYDDRFGGQLMAAEFLSAKDYLRCMRLRRLVQADFDRAFAEIDVLITVTTPTIAPPIGTWLVDTPLGSMTWPDVAASNTFPFNVTGMPSVSVPIPGGQMPVGLQITGLPYRDSMVLSVAEEFERVWRGSGSEDPEPWKRVL